jgi:hypothetical protein
MVYDVEICTLVVFETTRRKKHLPPELIDFWLNSTNPVKGKKKILNEK